MKKTLRFYANNRLVETDDWQGMPALDFIRGELGLTGTKEGCREGDCGSCAVLLGERGRDGALAYRAAPACLLALGELHGRHLITIEGLREGAAELGGLTPVMRALLDENGSQCGFCTPGFVISLTAWLIEGERLDPDGAAAAVEGNLCRCTGYASIRRAAGRLILAYAGLPADPAARLERLAAERVVPASALSFVRGELKFASNGGDRPGQDEPSPASAAGLAIGGGTDFYVRNPDPDTVEEFCLLDLDPALRGIEPAEDGLLVWAATRVRDFFADARLRALVPGIESFENQFGSLLIRNRATLGGNVANASPVADLTIMLLALDARAVLGSAGDVGREPAGERPPARREIPLDQLFLGYKKLDLCPGEVLDAFRIPAPHGGLRFNFEKVSKRSSLDIASVNSAAGFIYDGTRIVQARLAAGGVAERPLLLDNVSAFLAGREPDADTAREAARLALLEIRPISDVRGSADYRRRLLGRLVLAHFIKLFPASCPAAEALS